MNDLPTQNQPDEASDIDIEALFEEFDSCPDIGSRWSEAVLKGKQVVCGWDYENEWVVEVNVTSISKPGNNKGSN